MSRWLPLLLPVAASLCVAGGVFAVTRGSNGPSGARLPSDECASSAGGIGRHDLVPGSGADCPTAATGGAPPMAQVPAAGNVCQGTLKRPARGEPPRFSAMYTQRRDVLGIPIVGIDLVDPTAFDVAEATIRDILADPALRAPLVEEGAYIIIADETQKVLDLPEFACLAGAEGASIYDHVCGVADRADYPVVTVSELDMTGDSDGPCRGLNVLYHELGHLVHGWVLGPADYVDIRLLYQDALDAGKYSGEYAATNTHEYFAESTQAYFLSVDRSGRKDRAWLERYDPRMYRLLVGIYGGE